MNTYEAFVTGVTGRHVTVQAENQEAAEIEAMREFTALVGADCDVEVIDLEQVEDERFEGMTCPQVFDALNEENEESTNRREFPTNSEK